MVHCQIARVGQEIISIHRKPLKTPSMITVRKRSPMVLLLACNELNTQQSTYWTAWNASRDSHCYCDDPGLHNRGVIYKFTHKMAIVSQTFLAGTALVHSFILSPYDVWLTGMVSIPQAHFTAGKTLPRAATARSMFPVFPTLLVKRLALFFLVWRMSKNVFGASIV